MSKFHSYAMQRGLALNHFDCSGQILDRLWIVSRQLGAVEAFLFHAGISSEPTSGEAAHFPPGLHNAFLFAAFNALSFQMVLASPMILYAKSLGASATSLGIIAGMMPLLVMFQIPAASHVNRIGYRRFVLAGWSTRVTFIFIR